MVLKKALWFYEEPSPTEEPFFHLRLFKEMVLKEPWFQRFSVEPQMVP